MNPERLSNPIARVSAILAAVFLVLASVILATFDAKVIHSEIVFLSMLVTFGMGLISWLLGLRGLRAAKKQPGRMGRKVSLAGCVGGLPPGSLDVVTCVSALPYLTDIPAALRRWHGLLRSGGRVAFNCWSSASYITGFLVRVVAARHGIKMPVTGEEVGSPDLA